MNAVVLTHSTNAHNGVLFSDINGSVALLKN